MANEDDGSLEGFLQLHDISISIQVRPVLALECGATYRTIGHQPTCQMLRMVMYLILRCAI